MFIKDLLSTFFLLIVASRREQQLNGICRLPELKKPGKNILFD